jgi:hypothetical protein
VLDVPVAFLLKHLQAAVWSREKYIS